MIKDEKRPKVKQVPWPESGLERVEFCPVCGLKRRRIFYDQLTDRVFFCAPGTWSFWECANCGSAFLDPRPTPETIHIAYETYFTHSGQWRKPAVTLSLPRRFLRSLANGYFNRRFGTSFLPDRPLGQVLIHLLPFIRNTKDYVGRHLPKPWPGARLLDIGCGNGIFLEFAQFAGWQTTGIEMDSKAVAECRKRNLNVKQGGIELFGTERERFDVITLAHIIEHVHNPLGLLRACHRLLKSGGWLWIETPNIRSEGHRRYGHHWRGLEPPRHLVLFNRTSLYQILMRNGFHRVQDLPWRPTCRRIFAASDAIARGKNPYLQAEKNFKITWLAFRTELRERLDPDCREVITLKAEKKT